MTVRDGNRHGRGSLLRDHASHRRRTCAGFRCGSIRAPLNGNLPNGFGCGQLA